MELRKALTSPLIGGAIQKKDHKSHLMKGAKCSNECFMWVDGAQEGFP